METAMPRPTWPCSIRQWKWPIPALKVPGIARPFLSERLGESGLAQWTHPRWKSASREFLSLARGKIVALCHLRPLGWPWWDIAASLDTLRLSTKSWPDVRKQMQATADKWGRTRSITAVPSTIFMCSSKTPLTQHPSGSAGSSRAPPTNNNPIYPHWKKSLHSSGTWLRGSNITGTKTGSGCGRSKLTPYGPACGPFRRLWTGYYPPRRSSCTRRDPGSSCVWAPSGDSITKWEKNGRGLGQVPRDTAMRMRHWLWFETRLTIKKLHFNNKPRKESQHPWSFEWPSPAQRTDVRCCSPASLILQENAGSTPSGWAAHHAPDLWSSKESSRAMIIHRWSHKLKKPDSSISCSVLACFFWLYKKNNKAQNAGNPLRFDEGELYWSTQSL